MNTIKKNLNTFLLVWFFVLILNQILIFNSCFKINCLFAALPHTALIAFLIARLIIKEKTKKEETKKKEQTKNRPIKVPPIQSMQIEKEREWILKAQDKEVQNLKTINSEDSPFTNHIKSIENIKFEKIRKYCENLSKSNEADEMQNYLGKNGKMHKALIYDALEQFVEQLNEHTITLVDWGCDQGIGSMLVLDYIKEKQLDIKIDQILLFDNDNKKLSRAMAQVKALDFNSAKIEAFNSDDNDSLDILKTIKNDTTLSLFANDKMSVDYSEIDFRLLKNAYFMCVSNDNKKFVDEVYEDIKSLTDSQDLSIRDGKIGRFTKFERIFRV